MAAIATQESLGCKELEALVHMALDEAAQQGVDQAEVSASHDTGLSATARLGDVENLEYTNDRGIGVTVYKDSRKGSASTSDISPAAIREAVTKACTFAWSLDASAAISLAIECEAIALKYDPRINNSEGATVSCNRGSRAYGNTHGFVGSRSRTSHSISCVVLATEGEQMQRDYYYSAARDPADLESTQLIGETAAKRAVRRLGARKIKTTKAPVLFIPELARGFIGHSIGAIAGGAQYRRATFLLNASGEKIFPDFMRIEERPHLPKAMSSTSYDSEGVATYDRDIVTDGVLQGYVLGSYSARRLGLETTANAGGVQNLIVPGNAGDLESMIAEMGTGLIVEELIGQGVNPVTGDYSRGVVGQWVENGEIQYPVHEVTIAGNLRELYGRIVAIGSDQDKRGGIRCGSLLVEEMTIAGG